MSKQFFFKQFSLLSYQDTHLGEGVLPLSRKAVGVFYSPSQLGESVNVSKRKYITFLSASKYLAERENKLDLPFRFLFQAWQVTASVPKLWTSVIFYNGAAAAIDSDNAQAERN